MTKFDKESDMVLGTPRAMAAELEDFTDEIWRITREAERLTAGREMRDLPWLRQTPELTMEDGTIIVLSFTQGRPEIGDNQNSFDYASLLEKREAEDGGLKMIERNWSNNAPADVSRQKVVNSRKRPGGPREIDREYPPRVGFKREDIERLSKMMAKFRTIYGGQGG
jgi:hypothetical protein